MKFNPLHPFPCIYWKHGAFHLVKKNKWTRIGTTLEEAAAAYELQKQASRLGKLPALIESTTEHHIKTENLSDNTAAQYRIAAKVLARKFRQFDSPGQVKAKHVAKLKQDGAATKNMTNRVLSLLRVLFGYWLEQQLCDDNPCAGVKRFKEPKRDRLITMEEWSAIYDKAVPRLQAMMKLSFLTGQRIGDVIKIHRRQITEAGIEFEQEKTEKRLIVRWSPDLREAVAQAQALHKLPGMWLFMGKRGRPAQYRTVHRQWADACAAAGVEDARPNDQRAQSATATKRQGKNATALLGHSSPTMTERYLRDRETPEVDGPNLRQALDVARKNTR